MVLVAIRIVMYNGPNFIALPLGTHELAFDLLISQGSGQGREEGSTGEPEKGR